MSNTGHNKSDDKTKLKLGELFDTAQPILVLDGLLMTCDICQQTFVPEENLSFDDLIQFLRDKIIDPESPIHKPEKKFSKSNSQTCDGRNLHYNAFYKSRLRSGSDNVFDDDFFKTQQTPTKRNTSSSTSVPNSILLEVKRRKSSLCESISEDDEVFINSKLQKLKEKFKDQINWVKERGEDYVALETLDNIQELIAFLRIFLTLKTPAVLGFKINHDRSITVSYQFLNNFKKDFMMLKIGDNYRVFMSPF